jgi:RHS repeat-associated protein
VVTDVSGTPTELVSPDGAIVGNQQHTLWGRCCWQRDTAATPLRFPGQYYDQETGLHYHNHRYYDPETGAYLSPDPRALWAAPNPHTYVPDSGAAGDPLALLDRAEAATAVRDKVSELESGTSGEDSGTRSAAWLRTADNWMGSQLLSSHRLPVAAGVDGFDGRLFAGGPARNGVGVYPRCPL